MRVSFEISDKDIGHFRDCMKRARDAVKDADESDIIEAARAMFEEVRGARAPAFIKDRLDRLESMTKMLEDEDWQMPAVPRDRVLRALVYFCDPEDLIPDSIPGRATTVASNSAATPTRGPNASRVAATSCSNGRNDATKKTAPKPPSCPPRSGKPAAGPARGSAS